MLDAAVARWLKQVVTVLAILVGASYLFVLLVQPFGWPDWLARVSLFGAIDHPYLRTPPVEGIAFLAAMAVVGTVAAAAVAQRSPKVR